MPNGKDIFENAQSVWLQDDVQTGAQENCANGAWQNAPPWKAAPLLGLYADCYEARVAESSESGSSELPSLDGLSCRSLR